MRKQKELIPGDCLCLDTRSRAYRGLIDGCAKMALSLEEANRMRATVADWCFFSPTEMAKHWFLTRVPGVMACSAGVKWGREIERKWLHQTRIWAEPPVHELNRCSIGNNLIFLIILPKWILTMLVIHVADMKDWTTCFLTLPLNTWFLRPWISENGMQPTAHINGKKREKKTISIHQCSAPALFQKKNHSAFSLWSRYGNAQLVLELAARPETFFKKTFWHCIFR